MAVNIQDLINFSATDDDFNPYPQLDERYGPYTSVSAALSALTSGYRCIGLTVGVKTDGGITEYWFKSGITDDDLVIKTDGAYSQYTGSKTNSEYYSTLNSIIDATYFVNLSSNVSGIQVTLTSDSVTSVAINDTTDSSDTTTTSTSTESVTLAYLKIDVTGLSSDLVESFRTLNVQVSNNGGNTDFILDGDTINYSYTGIGGSYTTSVTLTLSEEAYNAGYIAGFYDTDTGELLSTAQSYTFDTPSDGTTNITIVYTNGITTTTL